MSADSSSDAAKSAGERLTLSAVTDGGTTALLQTDDHCEVRLPLFLLPRGAGIGSVLRLSLAVDEPAQRERVNQVRPRPPGGRTGRGAVGGLKGSPFTLAGTRGTQCRHQRGCLGRLRSVGSCGSAG